MNQSIWEVETFYKNRDIIIIGAGFSGLWSAISLKEKYPERSILILEKRYLKILKKLLVNVVNILAGIISLILLPFQSKYRYWGILKISESAGSFAGMAGIKYHEYKEDNKS